MPKYSSYPVVTSIASGDLILFHKNSTNSEVLVSYSNLITSISGGVAVTAPITNTAGVIGISAASGSTAGSMSSADKLKLDSLVSITGATAPLDLSGGVLSITAATAGAAGSMSAADKFKLDNASLGAVHDSLVLRGSSGQILAGSFSAVTTFGDSGSITAQGSATITGTVSCDKVDANRIRLFGTTDIQFGPPGGPTLVTANVTDLQAATSSAIVSTIVKRDVAGTVTLANLIMGTSGTPGASAGSIVFGGGAGPSLDYTSTSKLHITGGGLLCDFSGSRMELFSTSGSSELRLGDLTTQHVILRRSSAGAISLFLFNTSNIIAVTLAVDSTSQAGTLTLNNSVGVTGAFIDGVTGDIQFGTYTGTPITNTGYVTILDHLGNPRRLMVG